MPNKTPATDPKEKIRALTAQIVALTDAFCREHLNQEYAALCQKLVLKMSRKRAIPFVAGRPEIWAGAVVYALGQINFLFDADADPRTTPDTIATHFGGTKSSLAQKAKCIRDMFKMGHWDAEFSTAKMMADNPLADLALVDGLIVPRSMLVAMARPSRLRRG